MDVTFLMIEMKRYLGQREVENDIDNGEKSIMHIIFHRILLVTVHFIVCFYCPHEDFM